MKSYERILGTEMKSKNSDASLGGVDRRFVVVMKMNFSLDNFLGLDSIN